MEDALQSPHVSSSSSSDFERLSSGDGSREDLTIPDYTVKEEKEVGRTEAKEMQPVTAQVVDSHIDSCEAPCQPLSTTWEPLKLDVTPPKQAEEDVSLPDFGIQSQEEKTQSSPITEQMPNDEMRVTSLTADRTCCEGLVDFKKQPSNTEFTVEGFESAMAKSSTSFSSFTPLSDDSLEGQIPASLLPADTNPKPIAALEEELPPCLGGDAEFTESLKSDQSGSNKEQIDVRQATLVSSETAMTEQVCDDKGMGSASDGIYDAEDQLKQDLLQVVQTMSEVHNPLNEELSNQVVLSTAVFDTGEQEFVRYDKGSVLQKSELLDGQNELHGTKLHDVSDATVLMQSTEIAEVETPEYEMNVKMESDARKPSVHDHAFINNEEHNLATHENVVIESSQACVTFTTFESPTSFGDLSPVVAGAPVAKLKDDSVLDPVHALPYEMISEPEPVHALPYEMISEPEPFISIGQAALTPDSLSKSSADSSSASEIPTPDLVQGAHEGDLHDVLYLKNSEESTVDLVQTLPEPPKDTPSPIMSPSPEGSDSVQSPVLPDIIMESPSNVSTCRAETTMSTSSEPGNYLVESDIQQEVLYAQESSKFVTADEKLSDSLSELLAAPVGVTVDVTSVHEPMYVQKVTEETETPYMSVSCDLIKETATKEKAPFEVVGSAEPSPLEAVPEFAATFVQAVKKSPPEACTDALLAQDVSDMIESKDVQPNMALYLVEEPEEVLTPSPDHISREMVEEDSPSEIKIEYSHSPVEIMKDTVPQTESVIRPSEIESLTAELAEALEEPVIAAYETKLEQPITFALSRGLEEPVTVGDERGLEDLVQVGDEDLEEQVRVANFRDRSRMCVEPYVSENMPLDHKTIMAAPVKDDFKTLIGVTVKCAAETMEHEIMPTAVHKVAINDFIKAEKTELCHAAEADTTYLPPLDVHEVKKESTEALEISTLPDAEKKALEDLEKPLLLEDAAVAEETSVLDKDNTSERNAKPEISSGSNTQETPKDATFVLTKLNKTEAVDLLYWRDIKKTGLVFGASFLLLLSLTIFSIVTVTSYIALALLSMTISFRIYKGVLQAIQKSDEGHPFKAWLEPDITLSQDLVHSYSNTVLNHVNCTVKELRRLFLVEDLVDSLKFAVVMWLLTYVGALFNGLTLLILALVYLFSVPVIYERHQAQIDHYYKLVSNQIKDAFSKVKAKIPYLKRKTE